MFKNGICSLFNDIVGSMSLIKYRTVELDQNAHCSYDKCPNVYNALKQKLVNSYDKMSLQHVPQNDCD